MYGEEFRHFLNKLSDVSVRMKMGGNEGIHSSIKK